MTRKKQKNYFDNTRNDLRHWRIIQMPLGETRLNFRSAAEDISGKLTATRVWGFHNY